jgi:glutamate dehydrogenase (NADP+)
MNVITADAVNTLANNGCLGIIEGGASTVTPEARTCLRKRGLAYGPHTMTMTGPAIVHALGNDVTDELLQEEVERIYKSVKKTAQEFNAGGDLFAGANIHGFLRVANVMMTHGAV